MTERRIHFDNSPFEIGRKLALEPEPAPEVLIDPAEEPIGTVSQDVNSLVIDAIRLSREVLPSKKVLKHHKKDPRDAIHAKAAAAHFAKDQ